MSILTLDLLSVVSTLFNLRKLNVKNQSAERFTRDKMIKKIYINIIVKKGCGLPSLITILEEGDETSADYNGRETRKGERDRSREWTL